MKKILAISLIFLFIVFGILACANIDLSNASKHIGIYLPSTSPNRWTVEGDEMTKILSNKGYDVQLFYAEKNSDLQISQIEQGIENGDDAMIIAPVDPTRLTDVLHNASEKNIKIIAYDRFIENSDSINYFVSFDCNLIGIQQGKSLVDGLHESGDPPYNVELFAGCSSDSNAIYFYNGAMSVLQPLIDTGEIKILSGEISFKDVCLEFQNPDYPKERTNRLLETYYKFVDIDGILSPNDVTSLRIIQSIDGYQKYTEHNYPIITGQDAEVDSIIAITQSKQYSTILKDSKLLSQMAASMVMAVLDDHTPEINDTQSFSNGTDIVPAFLCEPVLVTKKNYKSILIDSGYMRYEDVFPETT
ncbi:MAG: sugar-binding protein [Eubacteriales bacterium]